MSEHIRDGTVGISRRRLLAGVGGAAVVGSAGCLGSTSGSSAKSGTTVVSSFFTFYDFARKVAAETPVTVENLVPVGLHGHGWEPDPTVTREIIDADAFVHVGEDFQPWADRAIQTARDDEAGTTFINAREGVDLVDLAASLTDEEEVGEGKDPHFWLDPQRAKQSVDNIATGLAEIAPEHEAAFSDSADALKDDLDTLDDEWQSLFDRAQREVVFLAAHNAFEYVRDRYDATIQPLVTNLAATDDVRPADMERARETIANNDLRYMGAAVFEPRRPARQLLSGTDIDAYYPVTPYAGTREEWVDRGWGYFDIARNINMPTFEILLGATPPAETSLGEDWRNFE